MQPDPIIPQLIIAEQLLQSGQVVEAAALLKRLHKSNPKHTDIMLQLAITERLQKHWPEAIALMKKAVALAPQNLIYTEHLANMLVLSNDGRNQRYALQLYTDLLRAQPGHTTIAMNLQILALRNDLSALLLQTIPPLITPDLPLPLILHYNAACAIAAYLKGDLAACAVYVHAALKAREVAYDADGKPVRNDYYYMLLYTEFLRDLLQFREQHLALYDGPADAVPLHVIGESHCLTPAHLQLKIGGRSTRVVPHLIMGAKAYFFTVAANSWQYALKEIIQSLPKQEAIVVCFGEIDCRAREGIMEQYWRDASYDFTTEIDKLCTAYMRFVKLAQLKRTAKTYILGVPAPNAQVLKELKPNEQAILFNVIRQFNVALSAAAAQQELPFLDIYSPTVDTNGCAKEGVHIDEAHLKPSVIAQVLSAI